MVAFLCRNARCSGMCLRRISVLPVGLSSNSATYFTAASGLPPQQLAPARLQIEGESLQSYSAEVQPTNWNDLRYLLAVKRGRTLTAAARQLRVDSTTVSRRLTALQAALNTQLVQRKGPSRLTLTRSGELVARRAEAMEQQFQLVDEVVGADQDPCIGTVRITSVPILVNRLLAAATRDLLHDHPGLIIELVPDSRNYSLTHREADIAIRLARPVTGGASVKARRIGALDYAVFASAAVNAREGRRLPWITFDDEMSHLPQARWIAHATRREAGRLCGLRVRDAETAMEAAAAGIGKTLLPIIVAARDMRLRRLDAGAGRTSPSREIWLLAHAQQLELARVVAATRWLERVLGSSSRK
jgi:DNA-binding transcriptional LysR family regulator